MLLPKIRHAPQPETAPPPHVRLADGSDAFVPSPTHEMHEYLWAFADDAPEPPIALYPGWVRLAVPVVGSIVLWGLIIGVVLVLR